MICTHTTHTHTHIDHELLKEVADFVIDDSGEYCG